MTMTDENELPQVKSHDYEPTSDWHQQPNSTDEVRTIACAICGDSAIEVRPGTGEAKTAEDGMKPGTGA